jgi:hypothetical protein
MKEVARLPRLRQVALVARHLEPVAADLRHAFGLGEPYRDPTVAEFGLENAVFAVGDSFLEVVAPVVPNTTAERYLDRRGSDGGYMAIFQVADLDAARRRVMRMGIRVVWQADLADIAGTHLHPSDIGGAIVSIDWSSPPETWRWAGPAWTRSAPQPRSDGGIAGITVAVTDPDALAARWADVLGVQAAGRTVTVDGGRQLVDFRHPCGASTGIVEVRLDSPSWAHGDDVDIAGVRFVRVRSAHG